MIRTPFFFSGTEQMQIIFFFLLNFLFFKGLKSTNHLWLKNQGDFFFSFFLFFFFSLTGYEILLNLSFFKKKEILTFKNLSYGRNTFFKPFS